MDTSIRGEARRIRQRLKQTIKDSANGPKAELSRIADRMGEMSARKAAALDKIIARLEAWQNSR